MDNNKDAIILNLESEPDDEDIDQVERKYRTINTATEVTPVQTTTAIPSIVPYIDAISFRPNIKDPEFKKVPVPHMFVLKEQIGHEYDNTTIEGCINTKQYHLNMKNIVDPNNIDLQLLTILYSVIVNEFDRELEKGRVILPNKRTTAKIYIPDLLRQMGIDGNINQTQVNQLLKKLKMLDCVYGYVRINNEYGTYKELARVFFFDSYLPEENAFTFGSRYFEVIAYYIQLARIRKVEEKTGKRLLDENGNLIREEKDQVWLVPGHTHLLKTSAYSATKRKFAWELASILCTLIERTGSAEGTIPNITAKTLIYGCRYFAQEIDKLGQKKYKNRKLKMTFKSVRDILENHSLLKETYQDIQIIIPPITVDNMEKAKLMFPHNGRIKNNVDDEFETNGIAINNSSFQ